VFFVSSQRILDESIHERSEFLEQVQQLRLVVELLEKSFSELSESTTTLQDIQTQLDKLKVIVVKVTERDLRLN
jgi:prefoldin subunit 5